MEEEEYRGISDTAKILYGVLLSRLALSRKNSWIEKDTGRLYITYNLKQLVEKLGRSDRTISKAMKQLSEVGLIEKKKEARVMVAPDKKTLKKSVKSMFFMVQTRCEVETIKY